MSASDRYPPIGSYGMISDCHPAALVSSRGSIDWYCLPNFHSGSCFGRLLDWDNGGFCSIQPAGEDRWNSFQDYIDDTLVLCTTFRTPTGEARSGRRARSIPTASCCASSRVGGDS